MADKNLEAELFGDSDDEDDPFEGLRAPQPAEADAEAAEEPEEDTRPASPPAALPRTEDDFRPDMQSAEPDASPDVDTGPPMHLEAALEDSFDASKLRFMRASNILGLTERPFDRDTFHLSCPIQSFPDGRQSFAIDHQNVVRFRWIPGDDGEMAPQTNSRFLWSPGNSGKMVPQTKSRVVEWEDGSMQLFVGSEVLDVKEQDMRASNMHLFMRHKDLQQGLGQVPARISFQPASLSAASHKRLRAAAERRHAKAVLVRQVATVKDPAKEKAAQEKLSEAALRDRDTLRRKQEKVARQYAPPKQRRRPAMMSENYLEADVEPELSGDEEDDDDAMRSQLQRHRYVDEDAERRAEQRLAAAKRRAEQRLAAAKVQAVAKPAKPPPKRKRSADAGLSDEDSGAAEDAAEPALSDDEDEEKPRPTPKAKVRKLVLDDSDDE